MEYRQRTASSTEEDKEEEDKELAEEMAEIRGLRTRIRSLEAELEQRLKGLRERANQGTANRSQIVKFINDMEGRVSLFVPMYSNTEKFYFN